eukprot:gene2663-3304_t
MVKSILQSFSFPINPVLYPLCAFLFCVVGLAFLASFIVSEITNKQKAKKNIFRELSFALISSITLGLGGFFVLLASGIYV